MLQDSINSWKASSAFCWLWKHFPCKKLLRCLKTWQWGVRWTLQTRQRSGAGFVPLLKHSLAVHGAALHSHGEELGPCWWPNMLSAGAAVFSASHQLAEHTAQVWWFHRGSENYSGSDWQTTSDRDFLWCKSGSGKCFGASSWSNHWASHRSCHIKSTFPRPSEPEWALVCWCSE